MTIISTSFSSSMVSPILILLLNVGCFFFNNNNNNATTTTAGVDPSSTPNQQKTMISKKRKISPSPSPSTAPATLNNLLKAHDSPNNPNNSSTTTTTTTAAGSNIKSYLKRFIFSSSNTIKSCCRHQYSRPPSDHMFSSTTKHLAITTTTNISLKRPSFASRADVYPCSSCGEVFNRTHLLDLHQATKHALAELADGDSGNDIVRIIFQTGWNRSKTKETTTTTTTTTTTPPMVKSSSINARANYNMSVPKIPTIHRILRIQNTPKTLAKFEEYRETVKSRAATRAGEHGRRSDEERCIADGNERLRFYCATYMCSLGREGMLCTCGSPFCNTCEIVRHGFGGKSVSVDGVATQGSGWAAHASLPEEVEKEFGFMNVRRAILVCRVVAGRVGNKNDRLVLGGGDQEEEEVAVALGEEKKGRASVSMEAYDSVVVSRVARGHGEEELVVFNPRAVLPCFLILYTV